MALDSVMRFTGSVVVATIIVTTLLAGGLWMFGAYEPEEEAHTSTRVEMLSRIDLAELLGEETGRQRPQLPAMEDIEPLVIPRRTQSGFVQVEYVVDANGRVVEAEVVGAAPVGVYEDQALEIVRSRRYQPKPTGADVDRRTEMVDFSIVKDPVEP
ncbi:MAG: TonB family protein [Gammaproteobacteria bacterium]